ncbi:MAG: BspA family leucine-rich repeat surface protein, partial [Atopobiaceae bacterium]|nr:BspA family leucine-rich repeat surface protein [Atopobiaceae bacterium]
VPAAALAEAVGGAGVTTQEGVVAEGTSGGCSWSVDADGRLDVWPTDGVSGTLDAWAARNAWSSYNDRIETAAVAAGTHATSDLGHLFHGQQALVSADLSGLDTEGATSVNGMFRGCGSLESVTLGDGWDTSAVTDFGAMFDGCESLTSIDASGWSLASAQTASYMFRGCSSLTSLSLAGEGGGSLGSAQAMFEGCSSLASLDLSAVRFGSGSESELHTTFSGCASLASFTMGEALYQGRWGSLMNESRLPAPTAANGMWWSTADAAWMTNAQIAERGPCADTLLSHEPGTDDPGPSRTDISGAEVAVCGWTYDGTEHGAAPTVTLGGAALVAGADYELSGDVAATEAGDYELVVSGKGAYEGEARASWSVERRAVTVRADDKAKGEGQPDPGLTATVEGALPGASMEYSLSRAPGESAGTYAITPAGAAVQGSYAVSFAPGTLTIRAAAPARTDISGAEVSLPRQSYEWTGAAIEPEPTVTLGGATLARGDDYDVSYASNVGPGTATVT